MQTQAAIQLELAGETVFARADAALHWPRARTAFIADLHLGKTATFRRLGIPVPERTADDLARLDALIDDTAPDRLIILGDLLHARLGCTAHVLDALRDWRARHAQLEILLIRGNHDRSAGDPPAGLSIAVADAPHNLAPFVLLHEPEPPTSQISDLKSQKEGTKAQGHERTKGRKAECAFAGAEGRRERTDGRWENDRYALCAHVHPAVRLRDPATGAAMRLPCFHVTPTGATLPAFGSFTGAHVIRPAPGDRVLAISPGGQILDLPGRVLAAS